MNTGTKPLHCLPLVLSLLSGGCASAGPGVDLDIELAVRQVCIEGEIHPIAHVSLINRSGEPAAVSETFGTTNHTGLELSIERLEGQPVFYPMDIDLFEEPPAICLGAGGTVEWDLDLLQWHVIVGGKKDSTTPISFDLASGEYRIRARYTPSAGRSRTRCSPPSGPLTSEWVEFVLPENPGCYIR